MRSSYGSALLIVFASIICGCGSRNAATPAATPEDAIKKFIVDEMLVTAGQYSGVNEGDGETFKEVIKWYEPRTLHADLQVSALVQATKSPGTRAQMQIQTIPKGTLVYRLVFSVNVPRRGFEKSATTGARLQNPRHASKYQVQGQQCDAVFYVSNKSQVLWVSPADFWEHTSGELKVLRQKGPSFEPGINETHTFH